MIAPRPPSPPSMESMLAMIRERRETPAIVTASFATAVGTMSATVEFDTDEPGPEDEPKRMHS